ncbi:hypothetical protein BFJ70_g2378 [Fusarium oxysporum]|nr:hypothetical protein BFJ70_g2378 [Fusarium oxysporum]
MASWTAWSPSGPEKIYGTQALGQGLMHPIGRSQFDAGRVNIDGGGGGGRG